MQADICELEKMLEMVCGKAQAHYHKQLKELKCKQEALQKELSRVREEGTASIPKPAMPSPLTTPKQKGLAIPIGPNTLRESPCMAL